MEMATEVFSKLSGFWILDSGFWILRKEKRDAERLALYTYISGIFQLQLPKLPVQNRKHTRTLL